MSRYLTDEEDVGCLDVTVHAFCNLTPLLSSVVGGRSLLFAPQKTTEASDGQMPITQAMAPAAVTRVTMDRLLPVINKLHDIFQRCGLADPIDLPQIVVVGSQSSGKSSVLEAIVGFDFLPRGNGVVTRSPIVIQLNKLKPPSDSENGSHPTRWVEFLHAANRRFESELDVQREIVRETERVAGSNKQLSSKAVTMKVFSKDVVDLTLIDLPGLTKLPVGDQPQDIEKLVRAMIFNYIEKPNTIILAVHPANTDLATSDALQMARKVDPQGLRTLGVITKLDIMDSGTNALDMLMGRVIPLRRGYVGVVNRSQADLEARTSVQQARGAERDFFHSHPVYAPYASKMGSQYLAETLSAMLMEHIRNVIPSIRNSLTSQLADVRNQLAELGPALSGSEDSSAALLHLLTNYASAYSSAIEGRPQAPISTSELAGGARISFIFHDKFGLELSRMDPFEALGTQEIRTALRNATGHRTPLFIPEAAFELLVKRQIHRFLQPSLSCVDMVYEELLRLAQAVESAELARFQRLRTAVADTTRNLLRERKFPTVEMIQNLIEMEMSYINTWHPDFVGGKKAIGHMLGQTANASSAPESVAVDSIQQETATPVRERSQPSRYHGDTWVERVEKNLLGQHVRSVNSATGAGEYGRYLDGTTDASKRRSRVIGLSARSEGLGVGVGGIVSDNTVPSSLRVVKTETMTEEENQELEILRTLLQSYFNIVRKRITDMVPRAIITFLVQISKESLQARLVSKLYSPSTVEKLMVEGDEVAQRRRDMVGIEALLEAALTEVHEIRDLH